MAGTSPSITASAYIKVFDTTETLGIGYDYSRYYNNGYYSYYGVEAVIEDVSGTKYWTKIQLQNGGTPLVGNIATPIQVDSNWHRVAFKITSTSIEFYFDGTSVATISLVGWTAYSNSYGGRDLCGNGNLSIMYIDEVLVCEGSGGIYPEHGPYYLE